MGEVKSFLKPDPDLRNGYKDKKRLADIHKLPCSLCYLKGWKQTSKTIAHHKIGMGLGKKASDKLSMSLCSDHHNTSKEGIHNMPLREWEEKYFTQDDLILITNKMLETL